MISERVKKIKLDELLPAKINQDSKVELLSFNGSGDITATLGSDGFILHSFAQGDLKNGDLVDFYFW